MSKRKKHRGKSGAATAQKHASNSNGVTSSPAGTVRTGITGLLRPASGAASDPSRKWRWLIFGLLSVGIAIGGWLYWANEEGEWPFQTVLKGKLLPSQEPEPRKKATWKEIEEQMRRRPPQRKWDLEKWAPVSDDDKLIDRFVTLHSAGDAKAQAMLVPLPEKAPSTDAEIERRDAGAFLRKDKVRVIDVWRGEPDAEGKPRPAAKRYVLVTKGGASVPSGASVVNPIVVVEVQGKKIQPLRTEINKRP